MTGTFQLELDGALYEFEYTYSPGKPPKTSGHPDTWHDGEPEYWDVDTVFDVTDPKAVPAQFEPKAVPPFVEKHEDAILVKMREVCGA